MPQAARAGSVDAVFVQSAASFTSDGDTITLHGVADATIYFTGRTVREVGHLSLRQFVELWEQGRTNGSPGGGPTAVVSFVGGAKGEPSAPDTIVELAAPHLDGGDLTYEVEVVEGSLPKKGGACALFIDRLRQPLVVVSSAVTPPGSSGGSRGRRAQRSQ